MDNNSHVSHNFHHRCILNKAGVPNESIIRKFAGEDIYSVEDFIIALSKLTRGARVPLEYMIHDDRHRTKVSLMPAKIMFIMYVPTSV